VNHTRFPKEDHLPDWVCRDKHSNKGDRVEGSTKGQLWQQKDFRHINRWGSCRNCKWQWFWLQSCM